MTHPRMPRFFSLRGFAGTGEALALGWDKGLAPIVGRLVLKRVTKVSAGFVTGGFVDRDELVEEVAPVPRAL